MLLTVHDVVRFYKQLEKDHARLEIEFDRLTQAWEEEYPWGAPENPELEEMEWQLDDMLVALKAASDLILYLESE